MRSSCVAAEAQEPTGSLTHRRGHVYTNVAAAVAGVYAGAPRSATLIAATRQSSRTYF